MHELEHIDRILFAIVTEAEQRGIRSVRHAHLNIGRMHGLSSEDFSLAISATARDEAKSLRITFDDVPVTVRCRRCEHVFTDTRFDEYQFAHAVAHAPQLYLPPPCPHCGHEGAAVVTGQEMKLVSIEGE